MRTPRLAIVCELFERIIENDRFCKYAGLFTVPFFAYQNDAAVKMGSGVLLRIGESHFIATAAHVVNYAIPGAMAPNFCVPLFIGIGPSVTQGIPLSDNGVHRAPDPWDVAAIELNEQSAAVLKRGKRFLNLTFCDIRPSLDPSDGYVVIGYPNDDSTQDHVAKEVSVGLHGYFTVPYQSVLSGRV